MNNWERNGFPDKKAGILYAIMLTVKTVPGAVIMWDGKMWNRESFSKDVLKMVKEVY